MFNSLELLSFNKEKNWAIPHFNVHNQTIAQGVLEAAKECNTPVIISVGYQSLKNTSLASLSVILKQLIEESGVKASLHFDHARDLEIIKDCINLGFTSVMFDGSSLALEENIKITKEVVRLAREKNISVEAEVGIVPTPALGKNEMTYTDPSQAHEFYEATKVDFLAVSLGSVHGGTEASHSIDTELLKSVQLDVPLVLHGASGVLRDSIEEGISHGLRKININTALKVVASQALVRAYKKDEHTDYLAAEYAACLAIKEKAQEYIYLFNAQNRA